MSQVLAADTSTILSPRKLQEMSLPAPDGHDVTSASGISMKQYEEQLNMLRKENFQLKLRIYFLEEKLGNGSPPAVQGLLEHNVRLQVEVEELRRQLKDKQELLAAAAEAIDVLEQQGSMSADSIETSMNNSTVHKKEFTAQDTDAEKKVETADETCQESESAGDYLAVTVNNEELDELAKLRRENRKALQMIKGCMKKIQQQDKEMKKLKLDKELVYAQVSDTQLEKYEEILKCKDEHIRDLEGKIREMQKNMESGQNDESAGNLQQLLTRRLQGLAFFLDKLLSHKCVLGEDKKKLAESILEQSRALPVGLKLDESMALDELTMDESNLDVSQSLRIEDLTLMFGHHVGCGDDSKQWARRATRTRASADVMSESECWSEPDRTVSLARMGLAESAPGSRPRLRPAPAHRPSVGPRSVHADEELNEVVARCEQLQRDKERLHDELEASRERIDALTADNERLRSDAESERARHHETQKNIDTLKCTVLALESKMKDVEKQLAECNRTTERMRVERQELETTYLETERSLRRAADEAAVHASQATLERARAQHDRLRVERELEETRDRLANVLEINAQLEIEATQKMANAASDKIEVEPVLEGGHSEEDRPTSPDQGIDSDRLSSLEQNDAVALSPRTLYEENVTLKQKLARTKATLAETLAQLQAANMSKRGVQRAICREIHKTQGVLRKARDKLENQN